MMRSALDSALWLLIGFSVRLESETTKAGYPRKRKGQKAATEASLGFGCDLRGSESDWFWGVGFGFGSVRLGLGLGSVRFLQARFGFGSDLAAQFGFGSEFEPDQF